MKLNAREAESYLRQPGKTGGALIYGTDGGQVRQRVALLADSWLGAQADPMGKHEFSPEEIHDDPAKLADELAAMSLMADRRVVLLREAEDAHLPAIEEAFQRRAPENFLIVYAAESLAGSKLRAWAEKQTDFAAVPCYKDEGASLDALMRDTLRGYGLRASGEVIRYLTSQLSGDRQIILNELEKLSLYMDEEAEEVSMDDAMAAIGENSDKGLDELAHAVATGDIVGACRLSDKLVMEGVVGVVIVRSLMRYFARIEHIAHQRADGKSLDVAIESLRPPVFFKAKPMLKTAAGRWSSHHCADALAKLHLLELDSKRHSDQLTTRLAHALMEIAALPGPFKRAA